MAPGVHKKGGLRMPARIPGVFPRRKARVAVAVDRIVAALFGSPQQAARSLRLCV